jgi:signal transduction histidine kinase
MKISKFINNFTLGIIFFSTFLTFFISLYFQYLNFQSDKIQIKNEFLELQKSKLKDEIDTIFKIIKKEDEIFEKLGINNSDRKKDLLIWLANYKLKTNGYIFVNSIDGVPLILNGKVVEVEQKYPNPAIFKQQLEAIKNPNGDFFNYKFKKPTSDIEFDKVSFVKKYDKYNWIIGTGVYLDEVHEELTAQEAIFKKTLFEQVISMLTLFILLLICIYFISKKLSKYINDNVENLTIAFEKAALRNKKIDTVHLTFKEFISLANNLNQTLEIKNKTKKKLRDQIKIVNDNVAISTTDEEGIITDASVAFCEMSGYSKEAICKFNT